MSRLPGEQESVPGKQEPFVSLRPDELEEILELTTGLHIEQVQLESFLKWLKQLREQNNLTAAHEKLGNIAVYCIGGIYRSPELGNLLARLNFRFADPRTIQGGKVESLSINLSFVEKKPHIGQKPVDTIIVAINTGNQQQWEAALVSLQAVVAKQSEVPTQLNVLFVLGEDIANRTTSVFAETIKKVFPDIPSAPPQIIKPW